MLRIALARLLETLGSPSRTKKSVTRQLQSILLAPDTTTTTALAGDQAKGPVP